MPNRIIKESINESRPLSELSFFAEDLFKRLITYADDYGRFNADYQIILARLYPREIEIVRESDIEDALIELSGAGKVGFYTSSLRKEIYGCFPNWNRHQRVRDSKNRFPDPDDTSVNDWYLRRYIPMKLKQSVIERDGFKCKICGKYISTIQDSRRLIKMGAGLYHIDHIVPVSQGGRATEENLQLTCPHCNLGRKRFFSFDEILEMTLNEKKSKVAADCGELEKVAADCDYNPIQSNKNPNPNQNRDACVRAMGELRRFEDFISAYPKDCNRHLTETVYCDLVDNGMETEDNLVSCAENYAEACRIEGKRERYIKNAENFLKDTVFEQYLPGKYKKPAPKKQKNSFNSFPQREYDFGELEKKLLARNPDGRKEGWHEKE